MSAPIVGSIWKALFPRPEPRPVERSRARVDNFEAKRSDHATLPTAESAGSQAETLAASALREKLGRDATPEELQRATARLTELLAHGTSTADAMNTVGTEAKTYSDRAAVVNERYSELLARVPTAEEMANAQTFFTNLAAAGKTDADFAPSLTWCIVVGDEYKGRHPFQPFIEETFLAELGRWPTAEETKNMEGFIGLLGQQGKDLGEIAAGCRFVIALTPEWQERHKPTLNTNRDDIYLQQPNGWSCGPTSLAMALTAAGLKPHSIDTMWEMANALGARAGVGTPGSAALIAQKAREQGANAEYNPSREASDVRAALERGHGAVVNGDLGGGAGHFIYIAGLDENGQYIVCDPWRPGITRWNDDELNHFTHCGPNPPGFAEIWAP